jgi:hypothetical protein
MWRSPSIQGNLARRGAVVLVSAGQYNCEFSEPFRIYDSEQPREWGVRSLLRGESLTEWVRQFGGPSL